MACGGREQHPLAPSTVPDTAPDAAVVRLVALERRLAAAAAKVGAEFEALLGEASGICALLGDAPFDASARDAPRSTVTFRRTRPPDGLPKMAPVDSELSDDVDGVRHTNSAPTFRKSSSAPMASVWTKSFTTSFAEESLRDSYCQKATRSSRASTPNRDPRVRKAGRLFVDASEHIKKIEKRTIDQEPEDVLMNRGVSQFYHQEGVCQRIVMSPYFQFVSLFMVGVSSIWISVEIDVDTGGGSAVALEVVSQLFCVYFVLELVVQIFAFKRKTDMLKDQAVMFDAFLVASLVLENWILAIVKALVGWDSGGGNSSQILLAFRLLRLLKILRLGRVLRQLPELLVIVRGIARAMKAISVVIVLLGLIIYMAGIAFRVLLEGTALGEQRFRTVSMSMGTLLIEATLSGTRGGPVMREAHSESPVYAGLLLLYVLLANVTVMGLLAGVLVQTVKTVTEIEKAEKEIEHVSDVMNELWALVQRHDLDGDGLLSVHEFKQLVRDRDTAQMLHDVGTDVDGLKYCAEAIFEQHGGQLTLAQFKRTVLNHRGKLGAKVKDHVETRQFIHSQCRLLNKEASERSTFIRNSQLIRDSQLPKAPTESLRLIAHPEAPKCD